MNRLEYLVGVYGFLQLSMIDVELLDKNGYLVKKKLLPTEQDAIYIYGWLEDRFKELRKSEVASMARETDKKVRKLISDHTVVNNFLLSIMLLREYLDNEAPKNEQILLGGKVNRLVDLVDGAISDDEFNADIKRTTARTANNIYRQAMGMAQLSDEVRDAHNKFRRV